MKYGESVIKNKKKARGMLFFWALTAYPLLQFAVFYIGVNLNSFLLAFQKYDALSGKFIFSDGAAFVRFLDEVINSAMMHSMIKNSLVAYLVGLLVGLPLNLVFSYFLYKKIFMSEFFRVVLFFPQILSSFVLSIMFQYFLDLGLPSFFQSIGISNFPSLLVNPDYAFGTVLFYCIWSGFGVQILIYTSAMGRIPESLVEVGKLDGISMLREFFSVTVPLIFPTVTTFLIAGIAGIFTNQIQLYNFYSSQARPQMMTLGYYFFIKVLGSESVAYPEYPYASAAGIIFTLIAAPLTLAVKKLLEKIAPAIEY